MHDRLSLGQHWHFLLILILFFACATFPFQSRFPTNWDAAQYVLAVEHFSIHMHQPHPPGYPLFVGLARILDPLLASAHQSVLTVSWIFGLAAVLALYWLTFSLWSNRWAAFLSAAGLLVNPLFWYYREVALTYTIDAFATVLLGGLSCRAFKGSDRLQCGSASLLGLLGGVRPSIALLLAPVTFLPSLVQKRYWVTLKAFAVFVAAVLAWLLPLMAVSGGPSDYWETSGRLANLGLRNTSVFAGAGLEALNEQVHVLVRIISRVCNLMLIPALLGAYLHFREVAARLRLRTELALAVSWILPSLFFFVFIHLGQAGYLLILIPLIYLATGRVWVELLRMPRGFVRIVALTGLSGMLVLHGLVFPLLPGVPRATAQPSRVWSEKLRGLALRKAGMLSDFSAQSISEHDRKIEALTRIVRSYPVSGTLVITAPPISGSVDPADPPPDAFRTLGTTCPEYRFFHLTRAAPVLSLRYFQTEYLAKTISIATRPNTVLVLVGEIPAGDLGPEGVRPVRTETWPKSYVGLAPGEFKLFGVRFQPGR